MNVTHRMSPFIFLLCLYFASCFIACTNSTSDGQNELPGFELTIKKLRSSSLTFSDGKFTLNGRPTTEEEKDELASIYLSLHVALHNADVLPRRKQFSCQGRRVEGDHTCSPSLPRESINKFIQTVAQKFVGKSSRCLDWGKEYLQEIPGCTEPWVFQYDRKNPRLDIGARLIYAAIDEPLSPALQPLDGAFDAIICTQVFEHLRYPVRAAKNIFTLLKPGGIMVFSVPFIEPEHKVPEDHFRYTLEGVQHMMATIGFKMNASFLGGNSMLSSARLSGFNSEDFPGLDISDVLLSEVKKKAPRKAKHWNMYWGSYVIFQKPMNF